MLSTEEFRAFAKEVVPFLHVTSRVEGETYPDLLSEKGGRGFPHLVAMDAGGEVVAGLEDRTVEGFRAMMKRAGEFETLLAKKDRTPAEEVRYLAAEIRLGRVKADAARARAAALKGLAEAAKKELDGLLLGLDIRAILDGIKDPAARLAAGRAFAEMWAAGRVPGGDDAGFQPFFVIMLDHAEAVKDAALFEKALGKMREKLGSEPRAAGFFKKNDERLAKLKEAKEPEPPKEEGK